jgi:hypothetical protein
MTDLRLSIRLVILVLLFSILLAACIKGNQSALAAAATAFLAVRCAHRVDMLFLVQIPEEIPKKQNLYPDIFDKIMSRVLNQARYSILQVSPLRYSICTPVIPGNGLEYRFSREGQPAPVEHTCTEKQAHQPPGRQLVFHIGIMRGYYSPAVLHD